MPVSAATIAAHVQGVGGVVASTARRRPSSSGGSAFTGLRRSLGLRTRSIGFTGISRRRYESLRTARTKVWTCFTDTSDLPSAESAA